MTINELLVIWSAVATVLWAISEALSLIPKVKANGVFQLVYTLLQKFKR